MALFLFEHGVNFAHHMFYRRHFRWHYFSLTICMKKNSNKPSLNEEIHDNEKDKRKMQPGETTLDLPDVKDIPGQEHIRPPKMKEFIDTTVSSDDEEGKGLLDFEEDEMNGASNVSKEEEQLLEKSASSLGSEDDQQWEDAKLDNADDE